MNKIFDLLQILLALLLIASILLQSRGAGLGQIFGGGGEIFRTKRGIEKGLFIFTIILATLFLVIALLNVVVF